MTIETRRDDERRSLVARLNDPAAGAARAERPFLAGAGAAVGPYGAHAREENGRLVLDGLVISGGRARIGAQPPGGVRPGAGRRPGAETGPGIERGALAIIETLAK
ncbi:MAG: hypothetical protein IPJ35_11325 [Elusimicrobia bacterium]|nr:hypothetical protein [Elusimicrobiota bacterium]